MIPVAAGVRIWIASGHTDMRKGMNGLALLVQEGLGRDPFCHSACNIDPLSRGIGVQN
jgi:transposase